MRNWLLGFLATSLWVANYTIYFSRDIAEWWEQRRTRRTERLPPDQEGPLAPPERHHFPLPEPPPHPVRDAEVVPFPAERRRGRRRF